MHEHLLASCRKTGVYGDRQVERASMLAEVLASYSVGAPEHLLSWIDVSVLCA